MFAELRKLIVVYTRTPRYMAKNTNAMNESRRDKLINDNNLLENQRIVLKIKQFASNWVMKITDYSSTVGVKFEHMVVYSVEVCF